MSKTLFLSTVTAEFGALRTRLAGFLQRTQTVHVRHQDDFFHHGVKTLHMLEEEIRESHIVVHVIGAQAGWSPPSDQVGDFLGRNHRFEEQFSEVAETARGGYVSATQWEAWLALFFQKRLYSYEFPTRLADGSAQKLHSERLHRSHNHPKAVENEEVLYDEIIGSIFGWEMGLTGELAGMSERQGQLLAEPRSTKPPVRIAAIRSYLERLVEGFRWLRFEGITEIGTLRIELESVYVALKAEPKNDYDRQQAADLHSEEVRESAGVAAIDVIDPERLEEYDAANIRQTYRPGREQAKWDAVTEVRTVADAFRQHRRMIILGGPGSGKTTLGRWLALQMARGFRRQLDGGVPVDVDVPLSQVDPDPHLLGNRREKVNLGPARIPIFLRIAHFARELADLARQHLPSVSLIDYLGRDPDSSSLGDGLTPDDRNALFRQFLEDRQAVVVLDGLDELTEANRRLVVEEIQDFIEEHTPDNRSSEKNAPWQSGGNQVVVTTRYVGYEFAPVRAGCAHFGIQSMQRPAVERFARSWTEAVNAELVLAADVRKRVVADELIAAIYNEARPAVRELATNPLLVTILATVYLADRKLPDQRAGVYDRVVEILLTIWLKREECHKWTLTREQLRAALEPLAAEMQQNASSNGLISLDRIGELIETPLAYARGMKPSDAPFAELRDDLLNTISKHVGLLAEQSAGNYAFFHRTIQEFMAARHLLANKKKAAAAICDRLDDPLWREPLLLALGFVMINPKWGPNARELLLAAVLAADGADALFPRAALLLVTALPDLRNAPAAVVGQTTVQLLTSYAMSLDQTQASALREQIERAFARLKEGQQASVVALQIAKAIHKRPGSRDLAGAAAALLHRIDWFTTELVKAMLLAIHLDRADQDWPIGRALLAALSHRPAGVPWLKPAPILQMSLLDPYLAMRRLLETHPELVALVQRDTDWLWLLVALYGGLGHVELLARLENLRRKRVQMTQQLPVSSPLEEREEAEVERLASNSTVWFSPLDVVHDLTDSDLSRQIREHLAARRPARDLIPLLERKWRQGDNPAWCAEALIGLAALGQDVVPALRTALAQPGRQGPGRAAIERFARLRSFLREPLVRTFEAVPRTIPEDAPEARQLDLLGIAQDNLLASGGAPLKVSDKIPECRFVDAKAPDVRAALDAEYWSYLFAGTECESCHKGAPRIGQIGTVLCRPLDRLIHSWSLLYKARNHDAARRLSWPQAVLPPRPGSNVEWYLAMLDSMTSVPKEFQFFAGCVLRRCLPFVDDHPDLLWETIALTWSQEESFRNGFWSVPRGFTITDRTLSALRGEGVAEPVFAKLEQWKYQVFEDRTRFSLSVSQNLAPNEWDALRDFVLRHSADRMPADDAPIWTSRATFSAHAAGIADPYLRFRAEWRFLIHVLATTMWREDRRRQADPPVPVSGEEASIASVPSPGTIAAAVRPSSPGVAGLVEQIKNPHDRVRASEWILLSIPTTFSSLWESTLKTTSRIKDPENRCRAQCRLALFVPEHAELLLQNGIESLGKITDPARRAETIREVRAVWGGVAGIQEDLESIAHTIEDPWQRDKALGRASRLVHCYRHQYAAGLLEWRLTGYDPEQAAQRHRRPSPTGSLPWGLVYLSATATEVEAIGASSEGVAQLTQLLGKERHAGVETLVATWMENGVRVTAREAAILDRMVQSGRTADLDRLWPFLERPAPEAQATVNRWSALAGPAGRWSALVQAEEGRLTPEVVASVIDVLADSTDRLHLRAAVALHGRTAYCENKNRRWSVQRVGINAVEAVARRAIDPNCRPAVRNSLAWIQHDLHHDDPAAIRYWLDQADGRPRETSPACWILEYLESSQPESVPPLLEALESNSPELQRTVLAGLARLANCSSVLNASAESLRGALSAVPLEIRDQLCVLRNGPVTLLEIARNAAGVTGETNRLAMARSLLEPQLLSIDDTCLSDAAAAHTRLRAIGSRLYINLLSYWTDANNAAADVSDPAKLLSVLLSWLEFEHRNPGPAKIIPHLLTATEAVARLSPDAFRKAAHPDVWEPFLAECVQSAAHWTTRLAAVRLLGRLRRVTEQVVRAYRSAMNDVSYVQTAAYETACEFRRVDADILPELLILLGDPSAGVAAATTQLLIGIARAECTASDRRRILRSLQDAVARSSMTRPVYLMEEVNTYMQIRFVDRLDRMFYRAIFEIFGL
jgi:hypothetical protein